jgi:hypothetical protein
MIYHGLLHQDNCLPKYGPMGIYHHGLRADLISVLNRDPIKGLLVSQIDNPLILVNQSLKIYFSQEAQDIIEKALI